MKIAINCIFCQPRGGGIKEYIVNLTSHLAMIDNENEYILYVLQDQVDFAKSLLPAKYTVKPIPYGSSRLSVIKRSLFAQRFWSHEEDCECFDIFHSPFFHAPKLKKAKLVITVHDLRLYRFPKTYSLLRYVYLQRAVKDAIRRADRIVAISQFTKSEILDTCKGINPDKITVIHEAINRDSFSASQLKDFQVPKEYAYLSSDRMLFSLGHIEPRKNYVRLIEAFKRIKAEERNADVRLVIAGKPNVDAQRTIRLLNATEGATYLNFVSHELLLWLYHNAALFVFPSFYEGFGFPPLEAASLGTVSAVSNVSSIPEVCGECAFYFDPYNVEDIAKTIDNALNNTEQRQRKQVLLEKQLRKFSWEKNVRETIKVYSSLKFQEKNIINNIK